MYESQHYVFDKFVVKVHDDDYGLMQTVRWAIVHKGGALKRKAARSIARSVRRGWGPVAVFAEIPLYPEAMMRGLDEEEEARLRSQTLSARINAVIDPDGRGAAAHARYQREGS